MTRSERAARKAYKEDLIKSGVYKELAAVMASVLTEYKIVKPVVNGNH